VPTPEKAAVLQDTQERIRDVRGLYLADFTGMTVESLSLLRKRCREQGVQFRVIKNTLLKRAFNERGIQELDPHLVGPTGLVFSPVNEMAPAKILADFAKQFERPRLKAAVVDGRLYNDKAIVQLAKLPSREVLLSQLIATFLAQVASRPRGRELGAYDLAPSTMPRGSDPEQQASADDLTDGVGVLTWSLENQRVVELCVVGKTKLTPSSDEQFNDDGGSDELAWPTGGNTSVNRDAGEHSKLGSPSYSQAFNGVERIELAAARSDLRQVPTYRWRRSTDAPPPVQNIDVTIYLMSALAQPAASAVPPELEGVVRQLKSTFSYKGYQLIDTQVIRVRAGQGGEASGVVDKSSPVAGVKTISQIKFGSASVSTDEKGSAIRIDNLRVGLRVPVPVGSSGQTSFQYVETGINTDVDIREGQRVVVGKANMDGTDRASIVVLTAKVVE